jgi:hypothetical protein
VSASLGGLLGLRICPQQGARFALVLVVGFLFPQSSLAQSHTIVRRVFALGWPQTHAGITRFRPDSLQS